MPDTAQRAQADERLLQEYFAAMSRGEDFARFFTDDVTWANLDTGQSFTGREAVREYVLALHTTMFEARPEARSLDVTSGRAFLEGEFVATGGAALERRVRVPFCLVYDLGAAGIRAMRLYTSFAALAPLARAGG
ncbi:hypothetical protein GTQ99_05405 [Kineococcus sp. T13]|uniref:nuclear transport factor 2 family protein n=1 Tax=Kineococcus vitellinus TaxID=2696565 RepID=UPI0014129E3D|nr:hypothetical protein [Kineococcus vitellinus]